MTYINLEPPTLVFINYVSHVSTEALTTGLIIPSGLIVHHQRYQPSDSNKIVDIEFSRHGAFLE